MGLGENISFGPESSQICTQVSKRGGSCSRKWFNVSALAPRIRDKETEDLQYPPSPENTPRSTCQTRALTPALTLTHLHTIVFVWLRNYSVQYFKVGEWIRLDQYVIVQLQAAGLSGLMYDACHALGCTLWQTKKSPEKEVILALLRRFTPSKRARRSLTP